MIKVRVFITGTQKIIENKNIDNFTDFILALLHTKRATTEKLDLTNKRFIGAIDNKPVAIEEVK